MFIKALKVIIITFLISIVPAAGAYAADFFPFEIQFDVERVGRLCYAGHKDTGVKYREGIAVTPDTCFTVSPVDAASGSADIKTGGVDIEELSAEISLIYENDDNNGSYTEVLKTYEAGSLSENRYFELLSDNNIANLEERSRLYSDRLMGLMITFKTRFGSRERTRTIYLYVCSGDDLDYFSGNTT